VPNWLVVPFLIAGLVVRFITGGLSAAGESLAGIGLAIALFGLPCLLQGMGMGDLKLAAGVGAWIGPSQIFMTFIFAGILGGVFAVCYALWHRSLATCLDSTADLLAHLASFRVRPHDRIHLGATNAMSIPYAPVIAAGTLLSFFTQ